MRLQRQLLLFVLMIVTGCAWAGERSMAKKRVLSRAPALEFTVLSDHAIELTWPKYSRDVVLERRQSADELFAPLHTFSTPERRFLDTTAALGAQIQYRLRPTDARYLAEYGPVAVVKTWRSAPPRPQLTRIAVDSVVVQSPDWNAAGDTWIVERRIGGLFTAIGQIAKDQPVFNGGGLEQGSFQFYRLRCPGNISDVLPSPYDSILVNLSAPSDLTVHLSNDHSALVTWHATMSYPCAHEIEKRTSASTQFFLVAAMDTSWTDPALDYGERTYYRVRARHNSDTSDFTPPGSAYYTLSPIDRLQADPVHDLLVHLTWRHPDSLVASFLIERSSDSIAYRTLAELSNRTFAFTDTLKSRGEQFYYRVGAQASNGKIAWSQPVEEHVPWLDEGMVAIASDSGQPGFFIDANEIAVIQYLQFCRETNRALPADPGIAELPDYWVRSSRLPVINVSWLDAAEFCNWRSRSVGLVPVYDITGRTDTNANGYRLPNRSEFLAALATAVDTATNLLASNTASGWPIESDQFQMHPVHVRHLVGNVWEWNEESVADRARLILGGAYSTPRTLAGSLPEFCYKPDYRSPTLGFRCVLPRTAIFNATR